MRGLLVWLLIVGALPAFAQTAAPAGDRIYGLVGAWTCITAAGSVGELDIMRPADNSLAVNNTFEDRNRVAHLYHESFNFDPVSSHWNWVSDAQLSDGTRVHQAESAGPWSGEVWLLEGRTIGESSPESVHPRSANYAMRTVYSNLTETSFRRAFQAYTGQWVTTSSSVCMRKKP